MKLEQRIIKVIPGQENPKFISKGSDGPTCEVKVDGEVWDGFILSMSSKGFYRVELIEQQNMAKPTKK